MLYHWRIINFDKIKSYLKVNNNKCLSIYSTESKWKFINNKKIDLYLKHRNSAKYYILFFNEYFNDHLGTNLNLKNFIKYDYKCEDILKFLESKNIIYFDIDLSNFKVDEYDQVYL